MAGTVERFEDLRVWQLAMGLADGIYRLTGDGVVSKDFAFRDQIRRAVISISSNLAEGFERDGAREFAQFVSIAKGSAGEVRSQLRLGVSVGLLNEVDAEPLIEQSERVSRMLAGLLAYLRRTERTGVKYRSTVEDSPAISVRSLLSTFDWEAAENLKSET